MRVTNRVAGVFLAIVCLVLSGCGTMGAPAPADESGAAAPVVVTEYRLGAGDQLRISVFGRPELTGQYVVNSQGNIAYPLLGDIRAGGMTLAELTASIGASLRQGYVLQPNVSIEVITYRPFFILGEVGKSGTYPFAAGLTVMNAVATAGGFSYRANTHRVFIQHEGEASEREYVLTSTTPVQPGDTVRIPERRF